MRGFVLRIAALACVVLMALGALATPAAAASVRQHFEVLGISYGYGGTVLDGHVYYACDTRADGRGIRTEIRLDSGLTDSVSDPNGSEHSGCGQKDAPGHSYASQLRVCRADLCEAWIRAF